MESNYFIPLLISGGKERGNHNFTIINDQVIYFQTNWQFYLNPISAYNALLILSKGTKVKFIPSELHRYFAQKELLKENKNWQDKNKAINEQNDYYILQELATEVEWNTKSHILIYSINLEGDFIILNFQNYCKKVESKTKNDYEPVINKSIKLNPEQAFILLANICITYFDIYDFFPKLINVGYILGRNSKMDNQMLTVYNFANKYMKWLEKKLLREEIDPLMILQLNGYKTLGQLLKRFAVQDAPAIQDLIIKTVQIVEDNSEVTKFELILYYMFYKEGCKSKFFKILRQWKIKDSEKSTEYYINKIEKNIESMLTE